MFAFLCAASFSQAQEPATTINDIPGMIREVKEFMESPPDTNPWVNEIVQGHIPLGVQKEELFEVLEEHGFKTYQTPEKYFDTESYDEAYTSLITFWMFPRYLFMHRVRLIIHFKDGKLAAIEGRVIYQSL